MTIVSPMGQLRPVFADKNGKRLSGGKVYTYEPGTLTPKATYADALNLIPNTNPINLDESGEADIYLDGGYRMQVFDRYGMLIQDVDNFRTWASGIPSDAISYNGHDLQQFNESVEAAIEDRYTKAETYSKPEIDTAVATVAGGKYSFTTYAKFDTAKATIPANSMVNIDEAPTGTTTWGQGLNTWDGVTLSKSVNDPVAQSRQYTDSKILVFSTYNEISGYVETVLDSNGLTRVKMYSQGTKTYFNDPRIITNSQDISILTSSVNGSEVYKEIGGLVTTILDVDGFTRIKEQNVTTGQFISYVGAKQKNLVAGTGISILETAETITIEAGETVYATPTEYVLALVIGQSNNTTEGGNATEAPLLPDGVCLIWNNTYSTLGDINASDQKASVVPAMALEFYKRTGMGLIVVNSAVGASAMSELAASVPGRSWDVTGTLRQPAIDRLNACKSYLDTNGYCYQMGFISWSQGEQDGAKILDNTITISDYTTAFTTFIEFIKTNVGEKVPFIITRTGYRTADNAAYKAIRDAQMSFAHTMPTVWMGYTGTTKFFNRNLMNDSVHYNQQGKNIIGNAIAKVATKLSAGVN